MQQLRFIIAKFKIAKFKKKKKLVAHSLFTLHSSLFSVWRHFPPMERGEPSTTVTHAKVLLSLFPLSELQKSHYLLHTTATGLRQENQNHWAYTFHPRNMEDRAQNRPVVIDNGTGVMKAGFAGSDKPKSVFPSFIGRPKHTRVMVQSKIEGDTFIGHEAEEHRGIMKLEYPMKHGIVENWADMEKIWSYVYGKSNLNVNSEDHPVLLTEAPLNPRQNRETGRPILEWKRAVRPPLTRVLT